MSHKRSIRRERQERQSKTDYDAFCMADIGEIVTTTQNRGQRLWVYASRCASGCTEDRHGSGSWVPMPCSVSKCVPNLGGIVKDCFISKDESVLYTR